MNTFRKLCLSVPFILIKTIPTLLAQWEYQESGVNVTLRDVCFVDSLYGWSIGDSSTIISTIDGGKSWIIQLNPDTTRALNKIQFINRNVGYIIGSKGLILKSVNGGINWLVANSEYTYNFSDVSFVDENTGWLSGWEETPETRTGIILHTSDGGTHWEKQIEIISDFLFGSTLFMSVAFLNDSIGWAFGGDYADNFSATYTYFTDDAGENWEIIGVWDSSPLKNLTVISKDTLWAGGIPFVVSFDSGRNWIITDDEEQIIFPRGISPESGLKGWAVHNNLFTNENKIMYTSNSGISWQEELDLSATPARAITNIAGKYLWVVGEQGLVMKKTMNVSSINSIKDGLLQNFVLEQNYPNPFNPKTVISYQLPVTSDVELSIYSSLGQKVVTLISQTQHAGFHTIQWDGSGFASGLYMYKLRAGNFLQTRKMLLIK